MIFETFVCTFGKKAKERENSNFVFRVWSLILTPKHNVVLVPRPSYLCWEVQCANLVAAAPIILVSTAFQTVIFTGSPGDALYIYLCHGNRDYGSDAMFARTARIM